MSLVLHRGTKSNSIPPVMYLHRSTNSKQLLSMIPDRSSLPRSSRLLIKNISQKCSRDDRKMTLGAYIICTFVNVRNQMTKELLRVELPEPHKYHTYRTKEKMLYDRHREVVSVSTVSVRE